jgi:hypothetical protein
VVIERVGVVVPAQDEEQLLPACLASLEVAAGAVSIPVHVVIVLDACTDRTAGVVEAAAWRRPGLALSTLEVRVMNVGAARRAGFDVLIDEPSAAGLWLASTDADSVVPPHWLRAQLAHAIAGASVVAGTVTVADWQERSQVARERAIAEYTATHHRHVHGANLSFAATAYLAAGGFPAQRFDEDVALVQAFVEAGESIAWAVDLPVVTSARRKSRAPFGFAGYLDRLEEQVSGDG